MTKLTFLFQGPIELDKLSWDKYILWQKETVQLT